MAGAFTREDYVHAQEFAETRDFSLRISGEARHSALAELIAQTRERDAAICDDLANGPKRTPAERATAQALARRIRSGRR